MGETIGKGGERPQILGACRHRVGVTASPPDTTVLIRKVRRRRELPPPAVRRALRLASGLTQADIAEVVGVTRECVARYELGQRTPRGAQLDAYLEVLAALAAEGATIR